MTLPSSIINAQVQRLLDVVHEFEIQQRQSIITQAQQEAQTIVRRAFHDARLQVREENARNRERQQQETARARARHHTAIKQLQHTLDQEFLRSAWLQLETSLRQCWQQAQARKAWIGNMLNLGAKALPVSQWRIELAPGYSDADLQYITQQVHVVTGQEPELRDAASSDAGMLIQTMGAVVDGSLTGLLLDRPTIEAQLLAAYHAAQVPTPDTDTP